MPRVDNKRPQGRERSLTFPVALRKHLEDQGYVDKPTVTAARVDPSPRAAAVPSAPAPRSEGGSTGTGFVVSRDGHVITNAHVVSECSSVLVRSPAGSTAPARVVVRDETNDLALLATDQPAAKVATIRTAFRLGEPVAAFGFPLSRVLSSSGNFTLGNVTALAGIGDDTRFLQISAPVQPGNSGGPLLDESGNVVGVVTGKLNAIHTVAAVGDIPQNVNFAIKANSLASFLESRRVPPADGVRTARLSAPDLADEANAISVHVRCD